MPTNTIEILSSINQTVKQIAQTMQPQNGSGAAATAKLSKGNLTTNADVNPAGDVLKVDVNKGSITELVGVLNTLSPSVLALSKISNSQVINFRKVIEAVIKTVEDLSSISDKNKQGLENAKLISEMISNLVVGINKAPMLVITAPIAIAGLLLAQYVVTRVGGVLNAAANIKSVGKKIDQLNNVVAAIDVINRVVFKAAALFAVCIGLGLLLNIGATKDLLLTGFITLGGIMLTVVALVGVTGLAAKTIKDVGAIDGINTIMNVVFKAIGLVAICMALGYLVMQADTLNILLGGLAVLGTVLVTLTLLVLITGLAGKIMQEAKVFDGLKQIMVFTLATIGLVALCFALGAVINNLGGITQLALGLGVVFFTLVALGGIFFLVGKFAQKAISKDVLLGFAAIYVLTVAAGVLVVGAKHLGDFVLEHYEHILAGAAATMWLMAAMVGIGALAGALLGEALMGTAALGVIELCMAGAYGLMYLMVENHKHFIDSGFTWDELSYDFLMLNGLIVIVGALAALAGAAVEFILLGAVALGAVELCMWGGIKVLETLIDFHQMKEDSGVGWDDMALDILGMCGVLVEFAALSTAILVGAASAALAIPGMLILNGFVTGFSFMFMRLALLAKTIDSLGGTDRIVKLFEVEVPRIMGTLTWKNLNPGINPVESAALGVQYAALIPLVTGMIAVVSAISLIANIVGVVDDQGRISPIKSRNPLTGEIEYGEPVDMKNVASLITGAIRAFVDGCNYGITDVWNMMKAAAIFEILGFIVDPVAKFVDMLTGYKEAGDGMLSKITIDKDGNVKIGQPVKVVDVAQIVAKTISSFVTELYAEEHTKKWAEIIYGDANWFEVMLGKKTNEANSVQEVAGVLGIIVDPIVKFMDMVTGLDATADGKIKKLIVDNNGNIKSGDPVDVKQVALNIASCITTFVDLIYGTSGLAQKSTIDAIKIEKILKPIGIITDNAQKLSSDKLNADLISTNSKAIMTANMVMMMSFDGIDIEHVASAIPHIQEMIELGADISKKINKDQILANSKSIVTFMTDVVDKKFTKSTETINKFTKGVSGLKKSIKGLDDVLVNDKNKRQKALDDFNDSLEKIFKTLDDHKDELNNFQKMMQTASEFNPDIFNRKDNTNPNAFANGGSMIADAAQREEAVAQQPGQSGETITQPTLVQALTSAIKEALDGMYLAANQNVNLIIDDESQGVVNGYEFVQR